MLSDDTMNADSILKFEKYDSRESSRDGSSRVKYSLPVLCR